MRILIPLFSAALLLAESAAGVHWTMPQGWKDEGAKSMRAAAYSVPLASGERDATECIVYFFGQGQGGTVEANIERWKGQFKGSDGKPAEAQVRKRTIHGLPVTTIDISGDYDGAGGPMATQKIVKPGYRLLGAVIEAPGGNLFIKFAGQPKTIAQNESQFQELLDSFQKEPAGKE